MGTGGFVATLEGLLIDGQMPIYRLSVAADSCSDGMSDRLYGWRAQLLVHDDGAATMMRGCCTLDGG